MSDQAILNTLGLEKYELTQDEVEQLKKLYIFITEDANWTHILDNWLYDLWHNEFLPEKIRQLSLQHDVFTHCVGDSDDSFSFTYYKKGQIIRQYIVEDPFYKGGVVAKNFGKSFEIETEALKQKEHYEKLLMIAKSLGITFNPTKENVRIYSKDNEEDFFFFDDER